MSDFVISSSGRAPKCGRKCATIWTSRFRADFNRLPSRMGYHDWKSGPFADEEQVLTTTDLEDVAVPVAEGCGGLDRRQVADLFQSDEQLLCAPENDHLNVRVLYDPAAA